VEPHPGRARQGQESGHGETGLTTLEWLLVVAGLAAVGVVVVQTVVRGTAASVAAHSARQEAADLAATRLENEWLAAVPIDEAGERLINDRYVSRCRQLPVIYSDVLVRVEVIPGGIDPNNPVVQNGRRMWDRRPACVIFPVR
jgi:hypothetical protein